MSERILALYVMVGLFVLFVAAIAAANAKEIATIMFPFAYPQRSYAELRLFFFTLSVAGAFVTFLGITLQYLRTGTINVFFRSGLRRESQDLLDEANGQSDSEGISSTSLPRTPVDLTIQLADEIQLRLDAEIVAQNGKANINLIFGSGAALIAFFVLAASIFLPPHDPDNRVFGATLASRIATSVTASVFAFFFLSTYRRNLSEIRYFHNETTNIESKLLAFRMYQERPFEDEKLGNAAYASIIESLTNTERNFLLKKGETTAEISHRELDIREQSILIAALSNFRSDEDKPSSAKESGARQQALRRIAKKSV